LLTLARRRVSRSFTPVPEETPMSAFRVMFASQLDP